MVARSGLFVAPLPGTPPVGTSPSDGRRVLAALFGTTFGVITGAGVTQSASTMTFTVAQTVWIIPDPSDAASVFLTPTDAIALAGAAGPGTGSRIDSIAVKQDDYGNGDADSRGTVAYFQGVASGSPVAPTLPAGYQRYANVAVPTSAANAAACTITYLAPAAGLMATFASAAARDAAITAPLQGMRINRSDLGFVEQYLAAWNSATNPTGAHTAGWYPLDNAGPSFIIDGPGAGAANALPNGGTVNLLTASIVAAEQRAGFAAFDRSGGSFTVPYTGYYDVSMFIGIDSAVTFQLGLIAGTAAALNTASVFNYDSPASSRGAGGSKRVLLTAGSLYSWQVYQGSGATRSVSTAQPTSTDTSLAVRWAAPQRS